MISHALLKVPSPDVEVVVLFHHLFAVEKLLLELAFGIDTCRGGQQHQDEESGLHWVRDVAPHMIVDQRIPRGPFFFLQ